MVFEVELRMTAYVSVDLGGEDAAREVARDKIANGPVLRVFEGTHLTRGHYLVKGLGAEVTGCRPFIGNRRTQGREGE